MNKPRIVNITKPDDKKRKEETPEDVTFLLDEPSQDLRKQQTRDFIPRVPLVSDKLEADALRRKIDEDRKKRSGLVGQVKDALGFK